MTTQTARATLLAAALTCLVGCGSSSPEAATPEPASSTAGEGGSAPDGAAGDGTPMLDTPSTLARADITGRALAQDEKRLYFAGPPLADADGEYYGPDGDLIWSVEKSGGHPKALFDTPPGPVAGAAVDGGKVFFSVGGALVLSAEGDMASSTYRKGQIMRAASGGGKPKVVAKNQVEPKAVAADRGQVFWFADDEGTQGTASVRRAAAGGGKVKDVARGATAPGCVAVVGKHVLWLSTGEDPDAGWTTHLWRANRDGGAKKRLATLEGEPRAVIADETTVFVATAGIIASVPIGGGDPVTIVDDSRQPQALALDADTLYWTTRETGQVLSLPKRGGAITTLAMNQTEVGGIVVDDMAIYWTVSSAIRKLEKRGPTSLPAGASKGSPTSIEEEPADPFAPIAEEDVGPPSLPAGATEGGTTSKVDPDNLPEKWLKCKRHKQCVLIETGCCLLVSVNKRSKKKARKALPHSTCDAECSYENITARCEDKLCRAVLSPK
jgi:hypothetical protein